MYESGPQDSSVAWSPSEHENAERRDEERWKEEGWTSGALQHGEVWLMGQPTSKRALSTTD